MLFSNPLVSAVVGFRECGIGQPNLGAPPPLKEPNYLSRELTEHIRPHLLNCYDDVIIF